MYSELPKGVGLLLWPTTASLPLCREVRIERVHQLARSIAICACSSGIATARLADTNGPNVLKGPFQTKIDHFGPFWPCECRNPVRN